MERNSWFCLFWYILQIENFSSGWNLKTTTISKSTVHAHWRRLKIERDNSRYPTRNSKNGFSPLSEDADSIYESRNIALFLFNGIILFKIKIYIVSIIKVCWVTQQFWRAYLFISIHSIWDTSLSKFVYVAVSRRFISGPSTQSCKFRTAVFLCVLWVHILGLHRVTFSCRLLKVILKL